MLLTTFLSSVGEPDWVSNTFSAATYVPLLALNHQAALAKAWAAFRLGPGGAGKARVFKPERPERGQAW